MRVRITVLVLLLGAALAAPTYAPARTMAQPYQGDRLAYVANGKLYVGFPGRARQMRGPGTATQPAFSHDGQWLAWIRRRPQLMLGFALPHLWLARADGSAAHMVASIHGVASFQWSPSADVLAVQPMARYGTPPIELVPAQGVVHPLPHRLQGEFLWSPDGRKLAVASMSRTGGAHFYVVSGATVHSYALPGMAPFSPVRLAAWWPDGHGILYWLGPDACESCIADGTKLLDYDLQTGKVHHLGISLPYPDWIAASDKRLLIVRGSGRSAFFGKHLQLCATDGPCRAVLGGLRDKISLDPAWSPGGDAMAFVVAPAWNTYGFRPAARYRRWLDAHVLWTARSDGSDARPAGGGVPSGVRDPLWTRDERGILFVKDGAL